MPSRVIREGLLESARYWSVPCEARDLFIHLILLGDDFGCFSTTRLVVGRRCFPQPPSHAKLEKLYKHLGDADLVRFYYAGDEKAPTRYGFIPRFRQTMRLMKARHPRPPDALIQDDSDAVKKFTQYRELFREMPNTRSTAALHVPTVRSADLDLDSDLDPESKRIRKEVEVGLEVPLPLVAATSPNAAAGASPSEKQVKTNDMGTPVLQELGPLKKADLMGMTQRDNEGPTAYIHRIDAAWPTFIRTKEGQSYAQYL